MAKLTACCRCGVVGREQHRYGELIDGKLIGVLTLCGKCLDVVLVAGAKAREPVTEWARKVAGGN